MRAIRRSASANAARCVPSRAATAHATTRTQSGFLKTKTVLLNLDAVVDRFSALHSLGEQPVHMAAHANMSGKFYAFV